MYDGTLRRELRKVKRRDKDSKTRYMRPSQAEQTGKKKTQKGRSTKSNKETGKNNHTKYYTREREGKRARARERKEISFMSCSRTKMHILNKYDGNVFSQTLLQHSAMTSTYWQRGTWTCQSFSLEMIRIYRAEFSIKLRNCPFVKAM